MKGQLNYKIQENIFKNQLIIKIKYFFIQYLIFFVIKQKFNDPVFFRVC